MPERNGLDLSLTAMDGKVYPVQDPKKIKADELSEEHPLTEEKNSTKCHASCFLFSFTFLLVHILRLGAAQ